MKTWPVLAAIALGVLAAGCQSMGPPFNAYQPGSSESSTVTNLTTVKLENGIASEWLQPPSALFTLGPGDLVEIEVLGESESRSPALVGPDGKLYFYLLPGINVWGLTLAEAKAQVERELTKFIRGDPKVLLTLRSVESKRVWLLGQLNEPGVYPLAAPMTLLEALATAGGLATPPTLLPISGGSPGVGLASTMESAADLPRSFVMRQGQLLPVNFQRLVHDGDLSQNVYLQPDDFVYLPTAATRDVYVLGAVAQPRAVNFSGRITLITAIANASGTIENAHLAQVAIVRGSLGDPKVAVVNFREIARGKAPDITLEPGDIVYVPFTPYRTLTRYVDMILRTFVQTVAVNEGSRAVSRGSIPVGLNIGVNRTQ